MGRLWARYGQGPVTEPTPAYGRPGFSLDQTEAFSGKRRAARLLPLRWARVLCGGAPFLPLDADALDVDVDRYRVGRQDVFHGVVGSV